MNKNQEGICPECGSKNLGYYATYWDDDKTIIQEVKCFDCGKDFDEIYKATYLYTDKDI